jgi:hypothetical protein
MAVLPGVRSVSLASVVPLSGGGMRRGIKIAGYEPRPGEDIELNVNIVSARYFESDGNSARRGARLRARRTRMRVPG